MQMTSNTHCPSRCGLIHIFFKDAAFSSLRQIRGNSGRVLPWDWDSWKQTPVYFLLGIRQRQAPVTYLVWPRCGLAGLQTLSPVFVPSWLSWWPIQSHFLQSQIWLKLLTGSRVKLGFCSLFDPQSKNNYVRSLCRCRQGRNTSFTHFGK